MSEFPRRATTDQMSAQDRSNECDSVYEEPNFVVIRFIQNLSSLRAARFRHIRVDPGDQARAEIDSATSN